MDNLVNGPEMPLGLGMALAQNRSAMNRFSALPAAQQQQLIDQTHNIQSKQEMRSFVEGLNQSR